MLLRMEGACAASGNRPLLPGRVDVIVVGGGLAGLTAAWRLRQCGVGDVLVLEAKDRVGGRTATETLPGGLQLDVGGQWVGPTQARVLALSREVGVRTFPTPASGRHVMVLGGERHVYRGLFPLRRTRMGLDVVQAAIKLDSMARQVPVDAPWRARDAAAWDATSLGDWLRQRLSTDEAYVLMSLFSGLTLGGDPDELSLLWVLQHIHSAGGIQPLMAVQGGAQDRRFLEGAQALSLRLAERLGSAVRLATPVERICWHAQGAQVHVHGQCVQARRVIVALSPADRQRITFTPELPAAQASLHARMDLFKGIKVQAVYERPFWREQGLSGQALSDRGVAAVTFDNSHPGRPEGVLVTFVAGKTGVSPVAPSASQLSDLAWRRRSVLDAFAHYFGPAARTPIAYVEKDWREEPWSAGCIPALAPGVLTEIGGDLRDTVGPIIWAGTETAHVWGGYMDGAVRSGEHAAKLAVA